MGVRKKGVSFRSKCYITALPGIKRRRRSGAGGNQEPGPLHRLEYCFRTRILCVIASSYTSLLNEGPEFALFGSTIQFHVGLMDDIGRTEDKSKF